MEQYLNIIQNPPASARGYTRWWWYGCAVTKDHIVEELEEMKNAGIGGVELQILYAADADSPDGSIKNIPFFSPEFFEILKFTADTCEKMGMGFDYTPSSGWPYGGPPITAKEAMQSVIPYQVDIKGPIRYSHDFTTKINGEIAAAVIGRMEDAAMDASSVRDVSENLQAKYLFGWPWGVEIKDVEIPKGNWKLVLFSVYPYRKTVGIPTREANGLVIDHCSHEAMKIFLDNMAQPVVDRLGKGKIGNFFCDSIEVGGHNWSSVLLKEFETRRGYSLIPYIYALWGDMNEVTDGVRYDYFLTMSELTIENFFEQLTAFCEKNQSKSRIQAHGIWGDILKVYGAADIPEGETFGEHDFLEVNTIHRRLASSAGHVYGRPIISNETFTWLKKPRFTETPENLKAAVDAVFLDGMNMIVNHGYGYSPKEAGKWGWPFYASCHINHTCPWWKYYRHIGLYIQTVSALLRVGRNYAEVGIYLPQADIWSENEFCDLHMAMKLEEYIGKDNIEALSRAGYWFDYLNDEAIAKLGTMKPGGLHLNGNCYWAILLPNVSRIPEQTAHALLRFVENGGILIGDRCPDSSCGLVNRDEKNKAVQAAMKEAFSYPQSFLSGGRGEQMAAALRIRLRPDVAIEAKDEAGYVHRVNGRDHIYFIPNISSKEIDTNIYFKGRNCRFKVYELPKGHEIRPSRIRKEAEGVEIRLSLRPYQSVALIFSGELPEALEGTEEYVQSGSLEILDFQLKVEEKNIQLSLKKAETWEHIKGLEYYTGEGIYSSDIEITQSFDKAILNLSAVHCAATVWINGRECGDIWKHPYELDISPNLRPGKNHLEICAVNNLINEALDPKGVFETKPVIMDQWPYFGKIINDTRERRVSFEPEKKIAGHTMPAGISSPVIIRLYQKKL